MFLRFVLSFLTIDLSKNFVLMLEKIVSTVFMMWGLCEEFISTLKIMIVTVKIYFCMHEITDDLKCDRYSDVC